MKVFAALFALFSLASAATVIHCGIIPITESECQAMAEGTIVNYKATYSFPAGSGTTAVQVGGGVIGNNDVWAIQPGTFGDCADPADPFCAVTPDASKDLETCFGAPGLCPDGLQVPCRGTSSNGAAGASKVYTLGVKLISKNSTYCNTTVRFYLDDITDPIVEGDCVAPLAVDTTCGSGSGSGAAFVVPSLVLLALVAMLF